MTLMLVGNLVENRRARSAIARQAYSALAEIRTSVLAPYKGIGAHLAVSATLLSQSAPAIGFRTRDGPTCSFSRPNAGCQFGNWTVRVFQNPYNPDLHHMNGVEQEFENRRRRQS